MRRRSDYYIDRREFVGAFIGATLVWLQYLPHWGVTEDKGLKLAVHCTAPAIRNVGTNLVSEIIGTFALIFIGAGAIIADKVMGGSVGLTGIALAHGLAIATMVSALGISTRRFSRFFLTRAFIASTLWRNTPSRRPMVSRRSAPSTIAG